MPIDSISFARRQAAEAQQTANRLQQQANRAREVAVQEDRTATHLERNASAADRTYAVRQGQVNMLEFQDRAHEMNNRTTQPSNSVVDTPRFESTMDFAKRSTSLAFN